MRSDMQKLLVLRGRAGRSWCGRGNASVRRDRRAPPDEDSPKRGKIRPRHGSRGYPSENFKPFYRFLLTQVGRPWDAVYSEIRAHLSPRNTIDMHIMQHLWDMVQPARPAPDKHWRTVPMPVAYGWGPALKVHPKTGRLLRSDATRARRSPPSRAEHRDLGGGRLLLQIDDNWFEVETTKVVDGRGFDVVLKCLATDANRERRCHLYGSHTLRAASKRQLGKKALKAAGLR